MVEVLGVRNLSRAQIPVPFGGTVFHIAMGGANDHDDNVRFANYTCQVCRL